MQIFDAFLNLLFQLAVVGIVTLTTAFLIVLNKFKEEIWEVLDFQNE